MGPVLDRSVFSLLSIASLLRFRLFSFPHSITSLIKSLSLTPFTIASPLSISKALDGQSFRSHSVVNAQQNKSCLEPCKGVITLSRNSRFSFRPVSAHLQ